MCSVCFRHKCFDGAARILTGCVGSRRSSSRSVRWTSLPGWSKIGETRGHDPARASSANRTTTRTGLALHRERPYRGHQSKRRILEQRRRRRASLGIGRTRHPDPVGMGTGEICTERAAQSRGAKHCPAVCRSVLSTIHGKKNQTTRARVRGLPRRSIAGALHADQNGCRTARSEETYGRIKDSVRVCPFANAYDASLWRGSL